MGGRRCSIPPKIVVDAVMSFRDKIVIIDEKGDMSVFKSIIHFF